MRKKVLFIGYGLDESRHEAVSINIVRMTALLSKLGIKSKKINLGYYKSENSEGMKGVLKMVMNLVQRGSVIGKVSEIIKKEKITCVHDTFVFPGVSLLFTLPLKRRFSKVKFIKEIQNNPGLSSTFGYEYFLRILLNRESQVKEVVNKYDMVISRNPQIARRWRAIYIPPAVNIHPLSRRKINRNRIRICFLGHPLKKKGIYELSRLVDLIPSSLRQSFLFSFALSSIGPKRKVEDFLNGKATKLGIDLKVAGTVQPGVFFRENDILLLPLRDEFGSSASLNTVLEAMEAGCLVVTTDTNVARGVISNNVNGILMRKPSAEEMLKILEKIKSGWIEGDKITRRARADIVKNYTGQAIIKKLKEVYA